MTIPVPDGVSVKEAVFYADFQCLMVNTTDVCMAWTVPRRFDEGFQLQVALHTSFIEGWSICSHGVFLCRHICGEEFTFVNPIRPISDMTSFAFSSALSPMWRVYKLSNQALQEDILRYYSKYLNLHSAVEGIECNVLHDLASMWHPEYRIYSDFLKYLLAVPGTRWVPPTDKFPRQNLLLVLLRRAQDHSQVVMTMVEVVVDYCLRQAKAEQDPHFLLPIRQCLHILVDPKQ